jgi:hypothetical protein
MNTWSQEMAERSESPDFQWMNHRLQPNKWSMFIIFHSQLFKKKPLRSGKKHKLPIHIHKTFFPAFLNNATFATAPGSYILSYPDHSWPMSRHMGEQVVFVLVLGISSVARFLKSADMDISLSGSTWQADRNGLVVYLPLWKIWANGKDDIPYIMKPPTSNK